jgi:hypothetical protein
MLIYIDLIHCDLKLENIFTFVVDDIRRVYKNNILFIILLIKIFVLRLKSQILGWFYL